MKMIKRATQSIIKFLQKKGFKVSVDVAMTGSTYIMFELDEDEVFTVRIANHVATYGEPTVDFFSLGCKITATKKEIERILSIGIDAHEKEKTEAYMAERSQEAEAAKHYAAAAAQREANRIGKIRNTATLEAYNEMVCQLSKPHENGKLRGMSVRGKDRPVLWEKAEIMRQALIEKGFDCQELPPKVETDAVNQLRIQAGLKPR